MPAPSPIEAPPLSRKSEALALFGALALFIFLASLRAWDHPVPFYDDVAYLDAANRIHESGGLAGLIAGLLHGTWPEDNRNPLYLAILSIFAGRDLAFHLRAKILGVAIGALALLASWFAARRLFNPRTALWVALFLASSETLIGWSAREACEPLLLFFSAFAFERLLRDSPSRRALFLGGLFAGFGQLTKGTGIFIAIAACLALALEAFLDRSRNAVSRTQSGLARIGCVIAGLALGGLPLFVRNLLRFRSPLHNYNDRFLWIDPLDDFSEVYAPGALARLDRGPLAYLHALTPAKTLLRLGRGLGETLVHLGDSMSLVSPRPFAPIHIFWLAIGIVAAFFSLRLAARWPRGFRRTLFFVHAAFMFAFFSFYNAVSGSSRYLLPLALTLIFPLAEALARQTSLLSATLAPGAASPSAAPAGSHAPIGGRAPGRSQPVFAQLREIFVAGIWPRRAVTAIALAVILDLVFDPREHQPPPGFSAAVDALRAHVSPGEGFAIDARTRVQPAWSMDRSIRMETISTSWDGKLLPIDAQLAELRARNVRWVLIDGTSRKDSEPRWFFANELPLAADGSLPLEPLPPALRLVWSDPESPRRFALLELLR